MVNTYLAYAAAQPYRKLLSNVNINNEHNKYACVDRTSKNKKSILRV